MGMMNLGVNSTTMIYITLLKWPALTDGCQSLRNFNLIVIESLLMTIVMVLCFVDDNWELLASVDLE